MKSKSNKTVYFENLDGLRFLAAIVVVLTHVGLNDSLNRTIENTDIKRFFLLFTQGGTAVSFFFVLSGYLITFILVNELNTSGKINLKNFLINRSLRIWPLYFVVVIIGLFGIPLIRYIVTGEVRFAPNSPVYYFLFLGNFDLIQLIKAGLESESPLMLHLTWSLSIEEQFYLLWPTVLIIFSKYSKIIIFSIVMSIPIIYRISSGENFSPIHTLNAIGDFGVGGMVAYSSINNAAFVKLFSAINRYLNLFIYASMIGFLMYLDQLSTNLYIFPFARLIMTFFFAYLILEQNYNQKSFLKMSRLKWISKGGIYSYGIYLLHPIGLEFSRYLYTKVLIPNEFITIPLIAITTILVTLAIASLSYNYFEKRFIMFKVKPKL